MAGGVLACVIVSGRLTGIVDVTATHADPPPPCVFLAWQMIGVKKPP